MLSQCKVNYIKIFLYLSYMAIYFQSHIFVCVEYEFYG